MKWAVRIKMFVICLAIAGSVVEIVTLGLGEKMSRADMFAWPVFVIVWAVAVLGQEHALYLNRQTIRIQARVIRNQSETLTQILTEEDKHDQ